VAEDRELLDRIQALIDASAAGDRLPRKDVEPTLTEGYARALQLDAECLRIEQRINQVTRDVAEGRQIPSGKLAGLLTRLHETEQQSAELRTLLAPLREAVAQAA
jgi:hypothetical protein